MNGESAAATTIPNLNSFAASQVEQDEETRAYIDLLIGKMRENEELKAKLARVKAQRAKDREALINKIARDQAVLASMDECYKEENAGLEGVSKIIAEGK